MNKTPTESSVGNTARDITKRIESFSKGIMETLKFDKRSTNPFDYEIEIGATEIHPKDLIKDRQDGDMKSDQMSKINGNNRNYLKDFGMINSAEDSIELCEAKILDIFEHKTASMFHTLLPLIFGHISALASSDPRSSVQVLCLIREILPHVAALNKIGGNKEHTYNKTTPIDDNARESIDGLEGNCFSPDDQVDEPNNAISALTAASKSQAADLITTSNHYCVVESEHPYKPTSISNYK